ncbi:Hypothetical protein A7982_05768 [Minicystis rosea]|nr:Hypothetical protein A7982_05768 [Minicystis rosea]
MARSAPPVAVTRPGAEALHAAHVGHPHEALDAVISDVVDAGRCAPKRLAHAVSFMTES